MADMPYETLQFTVNSVAGATARGTVTASPDPGYSVGDLVEATMAPPDTINFTIAGNLVGLFCGSDYNYCGN